MKCFKNAFQAVNTKCEHKSGPVMPKIWLCLFEPDTDASGTEKINTTKKRYHLWFSFLAAIKVSMKWKFTLLKWFYVEPEMVPSPASYMELQNGSI